MKIFDARQIGQWDAATMQQENISQTDLMKRAGDSCARFIRKKYDKSVSFYIACGKGGNGGDGLVIARDLLHAGYNVTILLAAPPDSFQGATLDHWHILQQEFPQITQGTLLALASGQEGTVKANLSRLLHHPDKSAVVIDALLGTGYKPSPGRADTVTRELICALNQSGHCIIAIDLPSGLSPDSLPEKAVSDTDIIRASCTISFQAYKRSFLHPESGRYTGKVHIIDIGLSPSFASTETSAFFATDATVAAQIYRPRSQNPFGHKGSFGTIMLAGGSYGKIGAIALSARAALRSGAGKVFILAPKCGYEILQTSLPEAMFEPAGESYIADIRPIKGATAGIGPGMDTHPESVQALKTFLENSREPLVLDADALNILAAHPADMFPLIPENSIITPHPGEFLRLFGESEDSMQQAATACKQAKKRRIIIVLKGHYTCVCTPDGHIHYNLSGNAGMATAGSGDVLTGIITALLGQGYLSQDAAILGVYLHGLAGDIYARKQAQESLMAQDLIDCLPQAFRKLKNIQGRRI